MKWQILCAVLLATAVSGAAPARNDDRLAGVWRLVSASAWTSSGTRNEAPFGTDPAGMLVYSRGGRMMVQISHGGRKPLSADRIQAPSDERAAAFATFFAYAGRYDRDGDQVVHHVEVSSVPNWVGTDVVRSVAIRDGRLTLRTPPLSVGGEMRATELVWERME